MLLEANNPTALCKKAYSFRSDVMHQRIKGIIVQNAEVKVWRKIRHFLGRLGAWPRAVKIILQYWPTNPALRRKFDVIAIPDPQALYWPHGKDLDLVNVLCEAIPELNTDVDRRQIEARFPALRSTTPSLNDKSISSRVAHAESALADHISQIEGFRFLGGNRYVGVSKPSCYCCCKYLTYHPLNLTPRQAHNKIYVKWSPMTFSTVENNALSVTSAFGMLGDHVRREIQRAVSDDGGSVGQSSRPDSVTDMTSSRMPGSVRE
jgi:hypothetical protein